MYASLPPSVLPLKKEGAGTRDSTEAQTLVPAVLREVQEGE